MITAQQLSSLIGQRIEDPKVQKVLSEIPGQGKRSVNDDWVYHTYKDFGLELVEEEDTGRITGIFLRAKKTRARGTYRGEIPERLSVNMTQAEIRKALGAPDQENGPSEDQWDKGSYRLGVIFDKRGEVDSFYLSAV